MITSILASLPAPISQSGSSYALITAHLVKQKIYETDMSSQIQLTYQNYCITKIHFNFHPQNHFTYGFSQ